MRADKMNNTAYGFAAYAAAICLLVYLRALSCDFINWDDPMYVMENPAIRILDRQFIREAFTVSYMGWWMPLTWISFAIDYSIWGLNPFGYHLTNIVTHAANAGLVVLIADILFRQIVPKDGRTEWSCRTAALLSALLWGIHPLRVESVVWVTERKDVLNGLFSLGSVLLYLCYQQRKSRGEKSPAAFFYLGSLCSLLLSLMAKPISVVIPAMLLVMDWYPLGRLKRDNITCCIKEKIPYVIISAATAVATLYLAGGESILVSFNDFSLYRRLILAGNSIFEYLKMTIYPVGLVNLYLLPRTFPLSYYVGASVSVLIIIGCAVTWRKRPWYLSTMLLFILTLVPVLGFFQNGAQAYADRFTYLPAIAVSIAGAGFFCKRTASLHGHYRKVSQFVLLSVVLILAMQSIHLTAAWQNPETLWSRVIALQPAGRAFFLRADYRMLNKRYLDAAEDLAISIRMGEMAGYPGVFNLHALRGDALSKAGKFEEAVQEFTEAIRVRPEPLYFHNRGIALKALGRLSEATYDELRAGGETGPIDWGTFPDI